MPFTSLIVLAAESGVDPELQLFPATAELIWGTVAFAALFAVLWGRVFPQMNKTLDARRSAIQGRMEEAETQLAEAEKIRRDYQA
ncbi:MAG TPA: ATP synthase F0 subunit B, partial [Euzebya sp.]|nr:ATP synthase F0 subunit B [Euzebya sp.]